MDSPECERSKLILLVEDEALIAMTESFVLKEAGYRVELASSGESAVEFTEGPERPDLILMDIDLGPGMDGTRAAMAILAKRKLPIVFLTSHSSAEMVRLVRGITRYGYVLKNSGTFVLLASIEMAFELFAKECALEERNQILQRAEEIAGIGYWYVPPGTQEIRFSPGSRAILGLDEESSSFEDFQRRVLSEASADRTAAFEALTEEAKPYDLTYRIHRADTGEVTTIKSSGRICGETAIGVLQDLSGIELLLGKLRKSEERQAVTLRSIGDGVIATDRDGRVTELNRMAEALTGWRTEEALGRPVAEVFSIVNASTRRTVENPIRKVIETGYIVGLANHTVLISKYGTERHISDSAAPILDDRGAMLGVVLVFRDITKEYLAQEQLRHDAVLFKSLFTDSHTPMLLIDPASGSIVDANLASESFYGWTVDEIRKMNIAQINTLGRDEVAVEMRKAMEEGRAEFRFVHRLADGGERRVNVVSGPLRIDGKPLLLSIVRDATEAYSQEMEARALRERSEVLMSDMRHRIKNNVQMLASLVNLQKSESGQDRDSGALAELSRRIASMALVYEHLYTKDGRESIDSREYLSSLLRSMESGFFPKGVGLFTVLEDMVLSGRFAISLGLIVGEFVTNACKHAFPSGRPGTISVSFARKGASRLELRVVDDGAGMDRSAACGSGATNEGLGLGIARSLVSQEGGKLVVESDGSGTSILCSFEVDGRECFR
jgi:PAS domain S-box-containing protein